MHYAVFGCVHGNAPALRAVLADIKTRGISRIVCLGDVVGYGPDPGECLQLVRESCFMTIRGDHDHGVTEGSDGFIPKTAKVLDWTREQLSAAPGAIDYLRQAKEGFASSGISFVHGSPRSPYEYLFPSDVTRDPRKLRAAFARVEKVCFCAHTHVPGVIIERPLQWQPAQELDYFFHFKKGTKVLVNVGSVGQPRDGDPRACWLEIDKNQMHWRRVDYDRGQVLQKLEAGEPFSSDLAIRLQKGR